MLYTDDMKHTLLLLPDVENRIISSVAGWLAVYPSYSIRHTIITYTENEGMKWILYHETNCRRITQQLITLYSKVSPVLFTIQKGE